MAFRFDWGGDPNNFNARTGPWNGLSWVSTFNLGGFPQGNRDRFGNRLVRIYGLWADSAFGANGIRARIFIDGAVRYDYTTLVNPSSGFNFDVEYQSGQLGFGRNTDAGNSVNDSRGGSWAGTLCGALDWATVPSAPGWPALYPQSPTQCDVYWGAPGSDGGAGLQGYRVEWAWNSSFSEGVGGVESGTQNPYNIYNLEPGRLYYFRISARNEVGWSEWGETRSIRMPPVTPAAPTVAPNANGVAATITWPGVATATGYEVQYAANSAFTQGVNTVASANNSATVTGLTRGQNYYWRVRAKNEGGWSNWSSAQGATQPNIPSRPSITAVSSNEDGNSASVSFGGAVASGSAITDYQLQRATDSAFTQNVATLSGANSPIVNTGLTPSARYYYRVRANSAAGYSAWSDTATASQADPGVARMLLPNGGYAKAAGKMMTASGSLVDLDGRIRNADNTAFVELGS